MAPGEFNMFPEAQQNNYLVDQDQYQMQQQQFDPRT